MKDLIDDLYEGFAAALPAELRPLARTLPYVLRLAPTPAARWSEVFSNEVTLAAPALVATAFRHVPREMVRQAVLAHMLSVIEAFGTDRVADGQVPTSRELLGMLESLRTARDSTLEKVYPGAAQVARAADRETERAIRDEHGLLGCMEAATFEQYRSISQAKQAVGFPASIALARAAGASETEVLAIRRALTGVWLGLQFEDDAVDWEDDWRRGQGAWAVSLARRKLEAVREQRTEERPTEPDMIRRRVFSMRILYLLLRASRQEYRSAERYARAAGTIGLAEWARARKERIDQLLPLELRHPGYVVRASKLAAWAAEVLS